MIKKKDKTIEWVNTVAMLLVVIGHSGFQYDFISNKIGILYDWIYNFHMPLFFFLSGYLFYYHYPSFKKQSPLFFVKQKFYKLFIPCLVLGTINFFIKKAMSQYVMFISDYSFIGYIKMYLMPGITGSAGLRYLWFLYTLFSIYCLVAFVKVRPFYLMLIALLVTLLVDEIPLFNLTQFFNYAIYFFLGGLFLPLWQQKKFLFLKNRYVLFVLFLVSLFFLPISPLNLDFINLCKLPSSLVGILMTFSFVLIMGEYSFFRRFSSWFSRYSFSIYLLSFYGQNFSKAIYVHLLGREDLGLFFNMIITGVLFPLLLCIYIDKIPSNNSYMRWLRRSIGRKEQRCI